MQISIQPYPGPLWTHTVLFLLHKIKYLTDMALTRLLDLEDVLEYPGESKFEMISLETNVR
jgi:hypothetical protein